MTTQSVFRRLPIATIVVLMAVVVVSTVALIRPDVLDALRRDPDAIPSGEGWRLLTALFVHVDGWVALAFNAVGIALIGGAFERRFGSLRFLLVYFIGGLAGQIAGYRWDPYGAGASVAMFSLVGAWAAYVLRDRQPMPLPALLYSLYELAAYSGAKVGGAASTLVMVVILAIAFNVLLQRSHGDFRLLSRLTATVALAVGLLLTVLSDNHGPPILIGALLALALLREQKAIPDVPIKNRTRRRDRG